ncbi:LOW QUALITY PROTEIN: hypothetical protein MXB_2935, partial [Myxobolus squamalis]
MLSVSTLFKVYTILILEWIMIKASEDKKFVPIKAQFSKILKIKAWREGGSVIFQCVTAGMNERNIKEFYWNQYVQNKSYILIDSEDTKIFEDKLEIPILVPNPKYDYNFSCEVRLRNGTVLYSKKTSFSRENILHEIGQCVFYPRTSLCAQLDDFQKLVFIPEGSSENKMEWRLTEIIQEYYDYSSKYNIMSEYFLPFICFSQYSFCDYTRNFTRRIHHNDLIFIMKKLKDSKFPVPDNVMKTALKLYQENKNSIISKTSKNSVRYRVKSSNCNPFRFKPIKKQDCLRGNGFNYNGKINTSFSGKPCLSWVSIELPIELFPMKIHDMDHNNCRNPGGHEESPYCYVEPSTFELCNIPLCKFGRYKIFNETGFLATVINHGSSDYSKFSLEKSDLFDSKGNSLTEDQLSKISENKSSSDSSYKSDSSSNFVLNSRSLVLVIHSKIVKKSPVIDSKCQGIPYIYEDLISLIPIETDAVHLHCGFVSTVQIKGYFKTSHPNCSLKLEEKCIVVRCEDSWDEIKKRNDEIMHPSIISLIGVLFTNIDDKNLPFALLYEPVSTWDVCEYFKSINIQNTPNKLVMLIDILKQVTSALCYIQKKTIVHGDISLRNIIISSIVQSATPPMIKLVDYAKFRPTYSDDYLFIPNSEIIDNTGTPKVGMYLPIKWMAPELIQSMISTADFEKITVCITSDIIVETLSKVPGTLLSEIYSFGVLVWELFNSAEKPFSDITIAYFIQNSMNSEIPR